MAPPPAIDRTGRRRRLPGSVPRPPFLLSLRIPRSTTERRIPAEAPGSDDRTGRVVTLASQTYPPGRDHRPGGWFSGSPRRPSSGARECLYRVRPRTQPEAGGNRGHGCPGAEEIGAREMRAEAARIRRAQRAARPLPGELLQGAPEQDGLAPDPPPGAPRYRVSGSSGRPVAAPRSSRVPCARHHDRDAPLGQGPRGDVETGEAGTLEIRGAGARGGGPATPTAAAPGAPRAPDAGRASTCPSLCNVGHWRMSVTRRSGSVVSWGRAACSARIWRRRWDGRCWRKDTRPWATSGR
jgi:hypothetical protein